MKRFDRGKWSEQAKRILKFGIEHFQGFADIFFGVRIVCAVAGYFYNQLRVMFLAEFINFFVAEKINPMIMLVINYLGI